MNCPTTRTMNKFFNFELPDYKAIKIIEHFEKCRDCGIDPNTSIFITLYKKGLNRPECFSPYQIKKYYEKDSPLGRRMRNHIKQDGCIGCISLTIAIKFIEVLLEEDCKQF